MRWLSPVLAVLISAPAYPQAPAQDAPKQLNIVIVDVGSINNVQQRTAREPIVQVEDENHKPVAGAAVVFSLAGQGAGGSFSGGSQTLTVITDNQGRAIARGFHANKTQGQYQMHVTASKNGLQANASIQMANAVGAGAGAGAGAALSTKLIIVIAIAGLAAAGGAYYATHNGGGTSAAASITITPGTGTVGPPH
jgi:hypothetical protein